MLVNPGSLSLPGSHNEPTYAIMEFAASGRLNVVFTVSDCNAVHSVCPFQASVHLTGGPGELFLGFRLFLIISPSLSPPAIPRSASLCFAWPVYNAAHYCNFNVKIVT